jgi:hypothetical protein
LAENLFASRQKAKAIMLSAVPIMGYGHGSIFVNFVADIQWLLHFLSYSQGI